MFEEEDKFKVKDDASVGNAKVAADRFSLSNFLLINKRRTATIVAALFFLMLATMLALKLLSGGNRPAPPANISVSTTTDNSAAGENFINSLPADGLEDAGRNGSADTNGNDLRAEYLAFGDFYSSDQEPPRINPAKLSLPLFVKTDVSNYYEVSRKIEFNTSTDKAFNQDGLLIMDNPFAQKANNFYSLYNFLAEQEIPQLVTGDFLIYYYQNRLKKAFKEVEENVFYKDVWSINKALYDIANNRYKKRKISLGQVNDPLLEGQRMEAAFFATALELLKPQAEQVNQEGKPIDENKFSEKESLDYNFELPDYLSADVKKEVALINKARDKVKSPIFLYQKNYADYDIPTDYKTNARLSNFYSASKWMNSAFPLYFRDSSCQDCLLDQNDWLINLIAAAHIAKDFSDNQDLKNQWARIYKLLSFFRGLRQELTYLQYQDVMEKIYGQDFNLAEIFSCLKGGVEVLCGRDEALTEAKKIQAGVAAYQFSPLEGGLSRNEASKRYQLGMRLLQEPYWPNDYIFSQLTFPEVTSYANNDPRKAKVSNVTACKPEGSREYQRCSGFGLDLINLLAPVNSEQAYFKENVSYKNYDQQVNTLEGLLAGFNEKSWHNNNFWVAMDINRKSFFSHNGLAGPIFTDNQAWKDKNINTALGAWVNLQLPADELSSGWQQGNSLGAARELNIYVEPNIYLVNELLANTRMLSRMLLELKVVRDIDLTNRKLNELLDELEKIREIIKKELNNDDLTENDQSDMLDLVKKYVVFKEANKELILFSNDDKLKSIRESVKGVKLMLAVYQLKDKKIFVAGPVFSYREY